MRNQRQAQNLESELESLFASTTPALEQPDPIDGSELAPAPDGETQPVAKRPRHAYVPRDAPPVSRPSHQRRPVASDLEHLPAQRLSQSALARQRMIGGYAGSTFSSSLPISESLVIDLSDDEDDDNSMAAVEIDVGGGSTSTSSAESSEEIPKSIKPSTTPDTYLPDSSEATRKRQLEAKENEIKRIMDRIRDMEDRKKRAAPAQSDTIAAATLFPANETTNASTQAIETAPTATASAADSVRITSPSLS
ncbi:uncharacterized protein JCM15063_001674 [Sporobolomyces koalae]|uniref:uncharacterized protein n=1 Tax=Sporobolomyces koalae TaxID=500713 RepID=UPI003178D4AA